jgi:hypothetical protein
MSFRRDTKRANCWRSRFAQYPELLQRVGLPDFVLKDERSLRFFVNEGCFQGAKGTPLVDGLAFLSENQQKALYELLSTILAEAERMGTIWPKLDSRFRTK